MEFVQSHEDLLYILENVWEIEDRAVLEAMGSVERHRFVIEDFAPFAYLDMPLPIGYGQNISAPHMVARMTELLELDGTSRVLEVRTRAGYHTAILAEMAGKVYTLEPVSELMELARGNLEDLGYTNIEFKQGDGYIGWPDEAPFDAIVVKGSSREIPHFLQDQLVDGGRMVIPIGSPDQPQVLKRITRDGDEYLVEHFMEVNFIPLDWEPGPQDMI